MGLDLRSKIWGDSYSWLFNWINNKVNSVSSGINSGVSICKTSFCILCVSIYVERFSLIPWKYHIIVTFGENHKGFEQHIWFITCLFWFICISIECRGTRYWYALYNVGKIQLVLFIHWILLHLWYLLLILPKKLLHILCKVYILLIICQFHR